MSVTATATWLRNVAVALRSWWAASTRRSVAAARTTRVRPSAHGVPSLNAFPNMAGSASGEGAPIRFDAAMSRQGLLEAHRDAGAAFWRAHATRRLRPETAIDELPRGADMAPRVQSCASVELVRAVADQLDRRVGGSSTPAQRIERRKEIVRPLVASEPERFAVADLGLQVVEAASPHPVERVGQSREHVVDLVEGRGPGIDLKPAALATGVDRPRARAWS